MERGEADARLAPVDATPEQLYTLWRQAADRSRTIIAEALAEGGPDQLDSFTARNGERPSLRRILLDLIEEYARHIGHADLIRASVDGLTGEGPSFWPAVRCGPGSPPGA
ncbi:DUF664 domain-containing protein [Kitasatospora sp. NPDC057965]|uniref:mycothiol transferase n=1 Tax=Kitasatospora sp. NPDC057965 TaxID=3346291 RepID=UPI0036DCBB79